MVGKNKNPPANEVTPSRFTSFFSEFARSLHNIKDEYIEKYGKQ